MFSESPFDSDIRGAQSWRHVASCGSNVVPSISGRQFDLVSYGQRIASIRACGSSHVNQRTQWDSDCKPENQIQNPRAYVIEKLQHLPGRLFRPKD